MHARFPKNFVLEERLERYADAIEVRPASLRGRWAEACWPLGDASAPPPGTGAAGRYRAVHLDLGCGKGAFIVEMARRRPDALFIGVDKEPVCIAYAAQHIMEAGARNAVAVPGSIEGLDAMFEAGELSGITLNFPTPEPKRRRAHERLVTADHLLQLRGLLAGGGALTFRTDNRPLFDYALPQFEAAGFELRWVSHDDRADHPGWPVSEYEGRLAAEGAVVFALCAEPRGDDPEPSALEAARALPQSLYDYLPDDLFCDGYTPHGMGYAVTNMRNARLHEQMRARGQDAGS